MKQIMKCKPYLECMPQQRMTMFPLFSKKGTKCAGSWLENTRNLKDVS